MAAQAAFRCEQLRHKLCVGTWAWAGNTSTFGADAANIAAQKTAFRAAVARDITFFDTAEIYSDGQSEQVLGQFIADYRQEAQENKQEAKQIYVATKFCPLPWKFGQSNLREALENSLKRMNLPYVDLYQVHGPAFSIRRVEVWAEALVEVHKAGLAHAVGVSNYNSDQVRRTHNVLKQHNIALESNQIEYSLLHRLPETSGLLKTCQELGVQVLAYSPLAMGRLTGKYTRENPPQGDRKFGNCSWEELERIIATLRRIGEAHRDEAGKAKTPGQVAINWVIAKGAIPIVGAKNDAQMEENAGAVGWSLTPQEVEELDRVSITGSTSFWQGSSD